MGGNGVVRELTLSSSRYFMYYHPVSTPIILIPFFTFWELVFYIITWRLLSRWGLCPKFRSQALTVVRDQKRLNNPQSQPQSLAAPHHQFSPQLQSLPGWLETDTSDEKIQRDSGGTGF
ncbi:hypothetical protein BC939DRAFT_467554 [Gamsiella multidivaricata]|uniref:uncharacterized protein n=1 Tax=Gamsiella multidivaricata TaxID=101098 RepID=UPI00221EDC97|nr:uncharacterized protein BC939DRAFT_467554 [Gamsiella multidivaricata]KAI7816917.1 hypothetical protein BC939DRAFT_467554 [Gamsiella multidivaricata]